MSPATVKLIETLVRLGKGMLTAVETWLKESKESQENQGS